MDRTTPWGEKRSGWESKVDRTRRPVRPAAPVTRTESERVGETRWRRGGAVEAGFIVRE